MSDIFTSRDFWFGLFYDKKGLWVEVLRKRDGDDDPYYEGIPASGYIIRNNIYWFKMTGPFISGHLYRESDPWFKFDRWVGIGINGNCAILLGRGIRARKKEEPDG